MGAGESNAATGGAVVVGVRSAGSGAVEGVQA